jgi:RNAse (barnase) inhibitor barstar
MYDKENKKQIHVDDIVIYAKIKEKEIEYKEKLENLKIENKEVTEIENNETVEVEIEEVATDGVNVTDEIVRSHLDNEEFIEEFTPTADGESRFYMLTQIDKEMENYVAPKYNDEISLEELCNEFRNFACNRLKLYYDIIDIRRFIAGLAVTKLLILQGMSGTGKTSLAYAFGEFLLNKTVVVPIQPMWKERTDLIGYYNEFTKKFNETTLLYKMYEANCNKQIYITVLDEMNIARVEYYFAEFLSLLELPNPEGRNLDVVSDVWENDPKLLSKGKLRLPINMWFIGTANNDDSTFAISDKVYDRAMVLNLDKKAEVFEAPKTDNQRISIDHLYDLFDEAQKKYYISDRNERRIKQLDKYLIDTFKITFGNRIMKQIRAYVPVVVACGGTELEALDDILSRKVLRKLESKNPVYVRAQSEALCNYLDDLFGTDKMPLCKETIHSIEQNV